MPLKQVSPIVFNILLFVLLVTDIGYSFKLHKETKLDGDMGRIVAPDSSCKKVLENPFGINVLLHNESYVGTNRFFSHWTMYKYFNAMPGVFQAFSDPIDSIYLSSAFLKTTVQLFMIFMISLYISVFIKFNLRFFLLSSLIIVPLFQSSGYNAYMGIIDRSPTYIFFYSLPFSLLLLFFFPFFKHLTGKESLQFSVLQKIFWGLLGVALSFSGPLIPGVTLLICGSVLVYAFFIYFFELRTERFFNRILGAFMKIPRLLSVYFGLLIILACYSLIIGLKDVENFNHKIPIVERYSKLPAAFYDMLTQKIGLPLLIISVLLNIFLVKKYSSFLQKQNLLNLFKWFGLFCVAYILLVPLGGYRIYRPNILRYDTIMPITISLFFFFGLSVLILLNDFSGRAKYIYAGIIIMILAIYENADRPDRADYLCERNALEKIASSKEEIVALDNNCTIMAWNKITDYRESELNARLLNRWGVTKMPKLYCQK